MLCREEAAAGLSATAAVDMDSGLVRELACPHAARQKTKKTRKELAKFVGIRPPTFRILFDTDDGQSSGRPPKDTRGLCLSLKALGRPQLGSGREATLLASKHYNK